MAQKIRIKLSSIDKDKLEMVCQQIRETAEKTGTKISGPIPLPRRCLNLPVRKSPCGEGTATWNRYEMRIHRRLIELNVSDARVMRQLMRIQIPEEVSIEMTVS